MLRIWSFKKNGDGYKTIGIGFLPSVKPLILKRAKMCKFDKYLCHVYFDHEYFDQRYSSYVHVTVNYCTNDNSWPMKTCKINSK